MRTLLAPVFLFCVSASPVVAAMTVESGPHFAFHEGNPGLCVDVYSDGEAAFRVEVKRRPELGYVEFAWHQGGKGASLTMSPLRTGFAGYHRYYGRLDDGRDRMAIWIPTVVNDSGLEMVAKVYDEGRLVHTFEPGPPPASDDGAECAALP